MKANGHQWGLGGRFGGFGRGWRDTCLCAVFHKFVFVVCRDMTLHNLKGIFVPLSDTVHNRRWDCWDWATIRGFEIYKVGGKVTLGELEFQKAGKLITDGLGGVVSNDAVGWIDEDSLTIFI